jgi:tetratricopeptide (TPR) repeat protein
VNLLKLTALSFILLVGSATRYGQDINRDKENDAGTISIDQSDLSLNLDPTFRFELEQALQRKDFTLAEQLIAQEIETNPNAPTYELLVYLGGLFFVDKRYLNSAVALKKAEAIEPLDNGNRFTLAMSYILLGRRDWARPELESLTKSEPGNPLYPYWVARLDYDDNEYAAAVAKLERLIEKFPGYFRAYDRLGLCLEALGRNEEAVAAYKRAIVLNRGEIKPSAWPSLNLGALLIQMGRLEESESYLHESVAIDPNFAQGHYKLGLALEKSKKYEESAASLRRASEIDPDYPDPYWALARVLRLTGDREGAKAAVKQFQKLKKEQEAKQQNGG